MPFYHKLGKIPHKRHTIFRRPDGELYTEELFGTEGFLDVWTEVAVLAALAVAFLASARRCLGVLERKARADGKLTVKWQ